MHDTPDESASDSMDVGIRILTNPNPNHDTPDYSPATELLTCVNATALFECILALRNLLERQAGCNISYDELGARCRLEHMGSLPSPLCVTFDTRGLLHSGLHLPFCGHWGGKAKIGGDMCYHGTKNLAGILHCNGVLHDAINTALGKQGWYHGDFATALWYASPMYLGRALYKPVLKVHTLCWNACNTWGYTKSGCMRYSIVSVIMVPVPMASW
jgi:hypothetical protein